MSLYDEVFEDDEIEEIGDDFEGDEDDDDPDYSDDSDDDDSVEDDDDNDDDEDDDAEDDDDDDDESDEEEDDDSSDETEADESEKEGKAESDDSQVKSEKTIKELVREKKILEREKANILRDNEDYKKAVKETRLSNTELKLKVIKDPLKFLSESGISKEELLNIIAEESNGVATKQAVSIIENELKNAKLRIENEEFEKAKEDRATLEEAETQAVIEEDIDTIQTTIASSYKVSGFIAKALAESLVKGYDGKEHGDYTDYIVAGIKKELGESKEDKKETKEVKKEKTKKVVKEQVKLTTKVKLKKLNAKLKKAESKGDNAECLRLSDKIMDIELGI